MLTPQEEIEVLKKQRHLLIGETNDYRNEIKALKRIIGMLNNKIESRDKIIEEKQSKIADLQSKLNTLNERFTFSTKRNGELAEDNNKKNKQIKYLETKVERLDSFADRLFNKLQEVRSENESLSKSESEVTELFNIVSDEAKELKLENMRLEAKTHSYEINFNSSKAVNPILVYGRERDIYSGEQKDIIIDILKKAMTPLQKNQRRYCVIQSILEANAETGERENKLQALKKILKENVSFPDPSNFSNIGMRLEKNPTNGHYKLYFQDDYRFMSSLSGTPSDMKRVAQNQFTEIQRCLF